MSARLPVLSLPPVLADARAPEVPLAALDTVWFQLTGTICNIACRHCFISCGPEESRVPMMDAARVRRFLDEAESLGARDYYFTGGEPMMHPDFWPLVDDTLARGPLTVLTNGLFIDDAAAACARRAFDRARYSFDLRVSLDGMDAAENDPVRGKGTFERIVAGLRSLARVGLSPAITVVEHRAGLAAADARAAFLDFARGLGLDHPRLKFLPLLRIGREPRRTHGYGDADV
ncbi:MAG TPA: radical SAM protein, partial [Polyangia bacterium]